MLGGTMQLAGQLIGAKPGSGKEAAYSVLRAIF